MSVARSSGPCPHFGAGGVGEGDFQRVTSSRSPHVGHSGSSRLPAKIPRDRACSCKATKREASWRRLFRLWLMTFSLWCVWRGTMQWFRLYASRLLFPPARIRCGPGDAGRRRRGDAAQGTERVAFVAGGLKPANLLLGGFEELREVLLGKPGLLADGGDLQRHIPCRAGALKAGG